MKNVMITLFLTAIGLLPAHAASSADNAHAEHPGHGAMAASAEGGMVDGVVKKVDKAAGKVTVSHGPLTNLNMPAMTMVFRIKDATWLEQMKPEGRIRFVADAINGTLTIVQLEVEK